VHHLPAHHSAGLTEKSDRTVFIDLDMPTRRQVAARPISAPRARAGLGLRRVVVTGIGLATPLGHNLAEFSQGLFGGGAPVERIATRFAEPVPGMRVGGDFSASFTRSELNLNDRCVHLALLAGQRALEHAGWSADAAADSAWQRCGVMVGNSSGPTESVSQSFASLHERGRVGGLTLLRCMPSAAAASLAMRFGLQGCNHTVTAACASSTVAIGEAVRAIRHGYLDRVLVGGTEAPFADGSIKAWEALRMLAPCGSDPSAACRPFDADRRGLVLGEGAVFFVLEGEDSAAERNAAVHAVVAGYGTAADGHHWTLPSAEGQVRAMRLALADAGCAPADVLVVNAYGSGTPVGDAVEARSIATVFGTGAGAPWVYGSKSLHGHALGASGALELAAVIATLHRGQVPPTRNLEHPDDLPVNLVWGQPRAVPRHAVALSNSFAFGGSNACLVVRAA
jgi:3-oxoacyl-[acyl-carrier-protein] synthase II